MSRAGKAKKAKKLQADPRIGPTLEQAGAAIYVSAGMAHRRVPVIDTLLERGKLSEHEHRRLAYYRDQATMAERSPVKSCLDDSQSGAGGHGMGVAVVSAMITTGRIERDLGSLLGIARAVAVEDVSLPQWCIAKHGGRERYGPDGRFVAVVPIREIQAIKEALQELRYAAGMIVP